MAEPELNVQIRRLREYELMHAHLLRTAGYMEDRQPDGSHTYPGLSDYHPRKMNPVERKAVWFGSFIPHPEIRRKKMLVGSISIGRLKDWVSYDPDKRNFIRQKVLPEMQKIAPGITEDEIASPGGLAVHPDYQFKGIGPMLHQARMDYARKHYRAILMPFIEGAKSRGMIAREPDVHVLEEKQYLREFKRNLIWAYVVFK